MDKLVSDGQYFSEDSMREREPYLHHELLGKFQDPSGRSMARPGERWSETLMRRSEEAMLVEKIRGEQQRLGVAEKDWVGSERVVEEEVEEEMEEEESEGSEETEEEEEEELEEYKNVERGEMKTQSNGASQFQEVISILNFSCILCSSLCAIECLYYAVFLSVVLLFFCYSVIGILSEISFAV